mgnify:CR=1 FL=1
MTTVKIQQGSTYTDKEGTEHGPGAEIELDDAVAKSLIDGGSALAIIPVFDAPIPQIYAVPDLTARRAKTR